MQEEDVRPATFRFLRKLTFADGMKMKAPIRRHWLRVLVYGGLVCCIVDAFFVEPHWIKTDRLSFGKHPSLRVVHISDIHYKGDRSYLMRTVATINRMAPDVVCFTGDIVEDTRYLDEALAALRKITVPLYGVPGNHEYWSGASFDRIGNAFRKTGGEWLVDRSSVAAQGRLLIAGRSGTEINIRQAATEFAMPGQRMEHLPVLTTAPTTATSYDSSGAPLVGDGNSTPAAPNAKRILLTHYPIDVENVKDLKYDAILSGHTHGGQVRLPFVGALIVPFGVNGYQTGAYPTPAGPLHVSAGLGTFFLPVRFFCRPEITLIEI
jgi:predicted MPP superfamily phosphohydrolase